MSSAAVLGRLRYFVNFYPVCPSGICYEQNIIVGRTDEQLADVIVFKKGCTVTACSSPTLLFICRNRNTFHITKFRNHNNHVFFLNHIFNVYFFYFIGNDVCSSVIAVFFCHFICFFLNKVKNFLVMFKQIFQIINICLKLTDFFLQIFNLQMSKPFKLHINYCLSLFIIKRKTGFKLIFCIFCITACFYNLYDFVNIIDCSNKSFKNMHSVLCNF